MSPTDIHKDIKRHWKRKEGDEKKNLLAKWNSATFAKNNERTFFWDLNQLNNAKMNVLFRFIHPKCRHHIFLHFYSIHKRYVKFFNVFFLFQRKIRTVENWKRLREPPSGWPDFSWQKIPKQGKIYQMSTTLPIGHKIYQMAINYTKWP
jgi:hypothetical protein